MKTFPIKITGYGITRLEETIFDVTEPTKAYASPFELYNAGVLPKIGMTSDDKIELRRCMWMNEDNSRFTDPGTVLYVSNENGCETDAAKRTELCRQITDIVIGIIQMTGLTCSDESAVYENVAFNLGPFRAVQEYRITNAG